jgi:hypothetical protein
MVLFTFDDGWQKERPEWSVPLAIVLAVGAAVASATIAAFYMTSGSAPSGVSSRLWGMPLTTLVSVVCAVVSVGLVPWFFVLKKKLQCLLALERRLRDPQERRVRRGAPVLHYYNAARSYDVTWDVRTGAQRSKQAVHEERSRTRRADAPCVIHLPFVKSVAAEQLMRDFKDSLIDTILLDGSAYVLSSVEEAADHVVARGSFLSHAAPTRRLVTSVDYIGTSDAQATALPAKYNALNMHTDAQALATGYVLGLRLLGDG